MSKPEILSELNVGKVNLVLYREDNGASWLRMSYNGTRLFIRDYNKNQMATALHQCNIAETVVKCLVACFEQEARDQRVKDSSEPKILFGNAAEDDQA